MRNVAALIILAWSTGYGQWTQLPDFPGTARDDAAAFAIDDLVFVGTGMEVGWGLTNDWYMFSGAIGQWTTVASLPATPRQYCSAFTDEGGNMGYIFGGLDANGPLNELWRYDPSTDTWQQMASLPGAPRYATVAADGGYVATGLLADGSATNELWKYDRLSDSWQQLESLPGAARHRATGGMFSGQFLIVGGANAEFESLADCWSYHTTSNTWSQFATLPDGRYAAMGSFNYFGPMVIGGALNASTIVDGAFSYDGNSSWMPSIPHPGGTRRGGVMIDASGPSPGGTAFYNFIGLGLSNELIRHNDWYMSVIYLGIQETSHRMISVHPNPTTDQLLPHFPMNWPSASCVIRDALGRQVLEVQMPNGASLDVRSLPPGRYELLAHHGDERLRAPFIKLP